MDPSFALVSNPARESRILLLLVLWFCVALPIVGLICWRVASAFSLRAASITGGALAVGLLVVLVVLYSRKQHFTLTVTSEAIRLVDREGRVVDSLAPAGIEMDVACHEYVGRAPMRIPVVVLRDKAHELTIGANASQEPPPATRRVAAPRYLVEQADLPRLIAAVSAARGSAR